MKVEDLIKDILNHIEKVGGFYFHGKWKGKESKPDIKCSCPDCSYKRFLNKLWR